MEFLGEANVANFLVGKKYLYLFQESNLNTEHFVAEIFRLDPQTGERSVICKAFTFQAAWLSQGERYISFELPGEFPKYRLVLVHGL